MTNTDTETLGQCPNCGGKFEEVRVGIIITIDRCSTCHGLWMDERELEKVLTADHRILQEKRNQTNPSQNQSRKKGKCPRCSGILIQLTNLRANVKTDSCPICYGVFLDRDELDAFDHPSLAGQVGQLLRKLIGRH